MPRTGTLIISLILLIGVVLVLSTCHRYNRRLQSGALYPELLNKLKIA